MQSERLKPRPSVYKPRSKRGNQQRIQSFIRTCQSLAAMVSSSKSLESAVLRFPAVCPACYPSRCSCRSVFRKSVQTVIQQDA